jgi:predicted DNA repair protein MutK
MIGATYLCYEGAEKVVGWLHRSSRHDAHAAPTASAGEDAEKQMTSGAIRTDFILSAEIMVIALNEVADQSFWPRFIILVVVAVVITAAVYGVVALIVKMDDIGLSLAQRTSRFAQTVGRGLVAAMPKLLAALSAIGTVAMLWVGGHILLQGTDTLGWNAPYGLVHHAEEFVHHAVRGVGGLLAWLVNTAVSAVVGLIVGVVVVAIVSVLPFRRKDAH